MMKVRAVLISICITILNMSTGLVVAEEIMADSFESGDLLETNAEGFKWTGSAWTSVVNSTHEVWLNNKAVNKPIESAASFSGTNWTARTGKHSLRFRYPAGEPWSEQRFDLGTPMKDLWIGFWLRVPENFSYGSKGNVNKFISLWSDGYSQHGDGSTVWLGMSRINTTDASLSFTYSVGGFKSSSAYQQYVPFIAKTDAGRWMHVLFHVKAESSLGAGDGVIQTFRRWEGESEFVKLHETFSAPLKIPSNGRSQGFKEGYFLGWADGGYDKDTEWLMDDLTILTEPPAELTVVQTVPQAPSNFSVETGDKTTIP